MFNIQHFACEVHESYQFSAAHVVLEVFPLEPGPKTCLKLLQTAHFALHHTPHEAFQGFAGAFRLDGTFFVLKSPQIVVVPIICLPQPCTHTQRSESGNSRIAQHRERLLTTGRSADKIRIKYPDVFRWFSCAQVFVAPRVSVSE